MSLSFYSLLFDVISPIRRFFAGIGDFWIIGREEKALLRMGTFSMFLLSCQSFGGSALYMRHCSIEMEKKGLFDRTCFPIKHSLP